MLRANLQSAIQATVLMMTSYMGLEIDRVSSLGTAALSLPQRSRRLCILARQPIDNLCTLSNSNAIANANRYRNPDERKYDETRYGTAASTALSGTHAMESAEKSQNVPEHTEKEGLMSKLKK
jgi:hypothetical protein